MKTANLENCQAETFALPASLTFQQIFQSVPFWLGGGYGYIPQVLQELRSTAQKKSYLLSLNQRRLVLSVAVGAAPFFDLRQQRVNPIIEQISWESIGPALVYDASEKGYMVSEYLAGRCWTKSDFRCFENIERVAELLKKLHALPQEGPVFFADKAEQHCWSAIRRENSPIPKRLHALQLRMQKVQAYAKYNYRDKAVCHNHLHASHMIETERGLRLVGWEKASINDPYYDLAVIAHTHQLSAQQIDHLLLHYAGNAGFDEREHFDYSYAIYIYLEALRCIMKADQEQQVEAHIDTLLSILHRLGV